MKLRVFMIALLICLAAPLALVSCASVDGTTAAETTAPPPDEGYLELECREIFATKQIYFGFYDGFASVVSLALPDDWEMSGDSESGYRFSRDAAEVATLVSGESALSAGRVAVNTEFFEEERGSCTHSILSATGESDPARRYHHRFVYKFEADGVDRVLTLTVGYTELCGFALDRLSAPIETVSKYADPGYGTVPFDAEGETRPILILGNSFISTSQIGSQLKAMFDAAHSFGLIDRTYSVEAYSRGYATVSKSWSDMLAPIKRGDYSAVFMCGFYSDSDETALRPYYEACLATGTPLVIFPAHNESYGLGAVKMYPEAYHLDWRHEINRLINSGIARSEFCIPDQHSHSTPLAGYVGAHMIYRALLGHSPIGSTLPPVSSPDVLERMQEYSFFGAVRTIAEEKINYLD